MKVIYITEDKLELLSEGIEKMTFYSFFDHIKDFLKKLLENPNDASIDDELKKQGLTKDSIISKMIKRGILKCKENITEVPIDESVKKHPLGKKMRAKYTKKYSIPKQNFKTKIRRLYQELIEDE